MDVEDILKCRTLQTFAFVSLHLQSRSLMTPATEFREYNVLQ